MKRASGADLPAAVSPAPSNLLGYSADPVPPMKKALSRSQASNLIGYSDKTLWLWVGAGFLALVLAWTALFLAARSADVRTVHPNTKGARP